MDKINELLAFKIPRWDELPDFDIYMDQVIYFINQKLAPLAITESDKPITSTMVNNYVKNSIVKPPIKKHYKKYHLAFLIVVTILKKVYSLSEISKMIEIQTTMKDSDLAFAYDVFGKFFEKTIHEVFANEKMDDKALNEHQRLLKNVITSVVLKIYTEINIERY